METRNASCAFNIPSVQSPHWLISAWAGHAYMIEVGSYYKMIPLSNTANMKYKTNSFVSA